MNKQEKLMDWIQKMVIQPESVLDAEFAGGDEDEVCIWTVEKFRKAGGGYFTSIILYYLRWDEEEWVEKDVSEIEGPALLNCPIRFFQYPVDEEMKFPAWRYEVKKYHEQVGDEVQNDEID